ncbi:MAG TPA: family 16 glycoside hydrolase [Actinokineospora sp.]|nr:family 16 glycoside hydrolase [Actinokineospora sp.]
MVASLSAIVLPTAAQADLPPQQPGVTLRTYDLQVELSKLCTLKPGQTPNVDKLMPTIDFTADADFGLVDKFATEVTANIHIATAGSHTFRLASDDGSKLTIDNTVVITNDGRHGVVTVDGSINLATGYHALRIDHFDHLYAQRLRLEWRPPGASAFSLVPNSVLSTEADVVRVTAPGRKECEGVMDSPGDGLPLTSVHPGYTLTDLRPTGFQPQVSAMDWLPDGRLAITTWGGTDNVLGEVYLLGNVTGSTTPAQVTTKKVAGGLREPMGVKYVDGKLYVSEKHRLVELNDTNGDEVTDTYRTVATWPYGGNFHEFAFGLLYKDGFFYLNLSVSINYGGASTDPQPAPNRGTTIKVAKSTGAVEYVAGGLRTPNGIGWGPDGDIFATDNQGGWLPSSKLVHIKQDRFFNHFMNPAGPFDTKPVTQPVLWLPQNEIANSPSTPLRLTEGVFAGQMLFGDVTYGGIQRAYLEKVNGEYQGAVFRLTQGLESGVNRISLGPDGAIYTGGIGSGGNWGQPGKLQYGLQKLTPNTTSAFDILAMRAVDGGFEFEYTQPLSTTTATNLAAKYTGKQWRYVPTSAYGGPKVDEEPLAVTSATLSADAKKVTVKFAGLKAGRVVYVRSPRPFASASGQSLWSTEAWYTLNNAVGGGSASPTYEAESAALSAGAAVNTNHLNYVGTGFVDGYHNPGATTTFQVTAPSAGTYEAGLRYSNGGYPTVGTKTVSVYVNGTKVRQVPLVPTANWDTWATKTDELTLNAGVNTIAYKYDTGDSGNVNLDNLTVTKPLVYEAEGEMLSGGAKVNTDHQNYSGVGFVDGYGTVGASTMFRVTTTSAGLHSVGLRYSNGGNPTVGTKTVSVYVNGTKVRQVPLAATANWDTWATQVDDLPLAQGVNSIAYKYDSGDSGNVNLDSLTVTKPPTFEAEGAVLSGGAKANADHLNYSGSAFVDGYGTQGASTAFQVTAAAAGSHNVGIRYSNGGNPTVGAKYLTVYVNGTKAKRTRLAQTANWDTWAIQVEALTLAAGVNTIAYKYDAGDTGNVNLDNLTVTPTKRVALFDGANLAAWEKNDGAAAAWPIAGGSIESLGGDIRTKQRFGDFKLHVEWLEPDYPATVTGQQRGNSGVYLQERYELQVLESFGDTTLANNEAGAIYSKKAPDRNMATAPGTWQTYDIVFRAARFDSAGVKVDNARVTVTWNGVVVHDDAVIDGGTGGNIPESADFGSIRLQDHGDAGENPRFRSIWIEPIG